MTSPSKTIGYLTLKNAKQVTVTKRFKVAQDKWTIEKMLVAKSTQNLEQSEVTFYEWGKEVAFLFKCDGTYCFPRVKENTLEICEHEGQALSASECRFKWAKEDQGEYYRLEHRAGSAVMILCCDERGSLFLKEKSVQSGLKVDDYLYEKKEKTVP